jgi:hypothetical protein
MKKTINLNVIYVEYLLHIRSIAIEPHLSDIFNNTIVLLRKRLFDYIEANKPNKEKAYVIALEIGTIIDYLYCITEKKDSYPYERIIKRYGYEIDDLLDNDIFQHVFPTVIFEDGGFYINFMGEMFIYKKSYDKISYSCIVYCGIDILENICISDEQNEYCFCTHLCRNVTKEEKIDFLNKIESKCKKRWDDKTKTFKDI